jgi:hypothetical protein
MSGNELKKSAEGENPSEDLAKRKYTRHVKVMSLRIGGIGFNGIVLKHLEEIDMIKEDAEKLLAMFPGEIKIF